MSTEEMRGALVLDFAGELLTADPGETLKVGRTGDLALDDNPYMHREFLSFDWQAGLWWVRNVGTRLAAYVTDQHGLMRSRLAPGAGLPLVFPASLVTFGAGSTLYELAVSVPDAGYVAQVSRGHDGGDTTITPSTFTESQLLAVLALAEPVLRRSGSGAGEIPSTTKAAQRLGWTPKRFDKKVENVCDKLAAAGVRGMRAGAEGVALNRRLHLVEYAVSTLLVTSADLPLLDRPRSVAQEESQA